MRKCLAYGREPWNGDRHRDARRRIKKLYEHREARERILKLSLRLPG